MKSEYDAMIKNNTWTLVSMDLSRNIVDYKWLFNIKYNPDGSIERYKAKLVAKGLTQRSSLDFYSTFNHVIKSTTVRLVLSIAVQKNWHIHQLYINNVFLQGRLEEEVFMRQPPRFVDSSYPTHICKLK